jgi:hypothetical protein
VPCVENRRWTVGRVPYLTLNVQGSCNSLCDTAPDPAGCAARNAANIAWLRQAFELPKQRRSAAVMIISQADPGWGQSDPTRAPLRDPKTLAQTDRQPGGLQDVLLALRDEVVAFRSPVACVPATLAISGSTSPSRTTRAAGWRTSRASKPSATTTCSGSGCRWTRSAARRSLTRR